VLLDGQLRVQHSGQISSINHEGQFAALLMIGYGRLQTRIRLNKAPRTYSYNADDNDEFSLERVVSRLLYLNWATSGKDNRYGIPSVRQRYARRHFRLRLLPVIRTSMTDSAGAPHFNYDSLSRMTSETRTFPVVPIR